MFQHDNSLNMDDHDDDPAIQHGQQPTYIQRAATGTRKKTYVAFAVLVCVNLLNYMDRFTIAGVLAQLKLYFDMNDQQAGVLQTVFIGFYMVCAPVCGYLGDRFDRQKILITGFCIWIGAVLLSTFVGSKHMLLFMFLRGVVGIGESSYSTVAPSIIADMFSVRQRTVALMIFYFAVPVGSGLGYLGGSTIAIYFDSWQAGVRSTVFIALCLLGPLIYLVEIPERGAAEHADHLEPEATGFKVFIGDLKYLWNIKTFRMSTVGFTCVVFAVGSLSWWTPTFMQYAYGLDHSVSPAEMAQISLIFGAITCLAGIFGVLIGAKVAQAWRDGKWGFQKTHCADSYVCATGSLLAVPFFFVCLVCASEFVTVTWVSMFMAVTCMCLNWSINMDLLMHVVVANRRATATAIQTMVSHMFGDASSPYIIGLISDLIKEDNLSTSSKFFALQTALYLPTFVLVLSGAFYLWSSFHVEDDHKSAMHAMHIAPEWEDDDDVQTLVRNSDDNDS